MIDCTDRLYIEDYSNIIVEVQTILTLYVIFNDHIYDSNFDHFIDSFPFYYFNKWSRIKDPEISIMKSDDFIGGS